MTRVDLRLVASQVQVDHLASLAVKHEHGLLWFATLSAPRDYRSFGQGAAEETLGSFEDDEGRRLFGGVLGRRRSHSPLFTRTKILVNITRMKRCGHAEG